MDDRYRKDREETEAVFVPENRAADSDETVVSPSGCYRLEICCYEPEPDVGGFSRGVVTRIADGAEIADVRRNYDHFWHAWVEHPNGNEYLLCGEDYQGYSVVNLTRESYHVHFPEEGHDGKGFCWVCVFPSPDGLMLAVDGCYWACPYEFVFFDFRHPEELPLPELARVDALGDTKGWRDNETFVLTRQFEVRKSDGRRYDDLSEEEQSLLDADHTLTGERTETVVFGRPTLPE